MTNRYERIRKARKALESLRKRYAREAAHPAITHCEECGCDWLDNGLNPVGCPYCKQSADAKILVAERDALEAEVEALRAEVERLNRILGRIVEGDGGTTVTIRTGAAAFAAAREYLLRNQEDA